MINRFFLTSVYVFVLAAFSLGISEHALAGEHAELHQPKDIELSLHKQIVKAEYGKADKKVNDKSIKKDEVKAFKDDAAVKNADYLKIVKTIEKLGYKSIENPGFKPLEKINDKLLEKLAYKLGKLENKQVKKADLLVV